MADMGDSGGGHEEKGKKRAKKGSTRVDMTPMVDLAFLLLTFFVLTSTFSKPKIMSLVYPAKQKDEIKDEDVQKINNAITFLLSDDRIFYYQGEFYKQDNAKGEKPTSLEETSFGYSGVRKLLADLNSFVLIGKKELKAKLDSKMIKKSQYLESIKELKKNNEALKVLIKTDDLATCRNFIDLIDELRINEIGVMAPVEMMPEELELVNAKLNK